MDRHRLLGGPGTAPVPDNRLNHVFNQNNNSVLGAQADREYAYDAAGNVIGINLAPVTSLDTFIEYGDHNRPNRVVAANEVDPDGDGPLTRTEFLTTAITHNGLGQRVRLRNTGRLEYECHTDFGFLWCSGFPSRTLLYDEAGHIIAEHRADGVKYEYIYADDRPVAFIDYAGDQGGGAGTVYWIHTDHLGTPRYATDASANVVWSVCEHAEPFNPKPCGGSVTLNLRFPGQYYLSELGMNYNYFRDYDPETGRYLQSDPIGLAGGLNTYAYANNNPLRFVDPLGMQSRGDNIRNAITGAGGAIQIIAGGGLCLSGGGCVVGGALFVLGVSNAVEGGTGLSHQGGEGFNFVQGAIQTTLDLRFDHDTAQRVSVGLNGILNLGFDLAFLNLPKAASDGTAFIAKGTLDDVAVFVRRQKDGLTKQGVASQAFFDAFTTFNTIDALQCR